MCQVDCPTIALQTAEQNLETTVKALGRTSALILRGLDCVAGVTGEGRLGAGSWHGFCLGPHLPGCWRALSREKVTMNLGKKRSSGIPGASC